VNIRILLRIIVTLALAVPSTAFAQAAAESALINALSSSATVKAGSALNHTLNQSTTQLGSRIQQRTAGPVQMGTQRQAPAARTKNSATGMLAAGAVHSASPQAMRGISVQGGEITCPTNTATSQGSSAKTTVSEDSHRSTSGPKSEAEANKYKSFIMLPAPK
jgi:hypothetical protein